jgi:uncharacterized protein (TIGR03118 family)
MINRSNWHGIVRGAVAIGAAVSLLVGPSSALADTRTAFAETDLVSDQAGLATITDTNAVNSWGLALTPTSPLWVANNGTNTSTLYSGGNATTPIAKAALTVEIPGGAPTGMAFNPTTQFVVTGPGGSGAARFLFVSEDGDLTGWNPTADGTHAIVAAHVDGAVYKGLALWTNPFGTFLLAADFANGRIDVFDGSFNRLTLPAGAFRDPRLPKGHAPFNVLTVEDKVFVAYAKQQPGSDDEQAGPGLGIVDEYSNVGLTAQRVASHGTLNAPWGLAIAPASFGRFAGALLVGNFGDGRIGAYRGHQFLGLLRDDQGTPLAIDGLWALLPGTANTGGVDSLWFSAGPDDEQHGLVGLIRPVVA